jgi:N utilization substance protein B
MSRRLARELALKILYRYEEGDRDLPGILAATLQRKKYADTDKEFCTHLVKKTVSNLDDIDQHITKVLKNWPYNRVSVIDKVILRLGACEILYFHDIPPQVTINEAIELGKKFGGSDSSRFINGVIDAVRKNYESSNNR